MAKRLRPFEHEDDDLAAKAEPEPPGADLAKRRRSQRSCLLLAAGGFGLIGLTGCGSSRSADVAVTACQSDPNGGQPTASGTIHNRKGDTSYQFDLQFLDGTGRLVSHQIVKVPSITKDETQNWNATGIAFFKGDVSCAVHTLGKLKS